MRKALIAAILLLAPLTGSCLSNSLAAAPSLEVGATDFLASSLFWRAVDELRRHELASLTATNPGQSFVPPEDGASVLATVGLDLALHNSLPRAAVPASKNFCADMSISLCAVRRIVERECRAIREESAGRPFKRLDANKEKLS
jgi:hypothetical protein